MHIDKDSERLVFTRGAEPNDSISCPVAWVPMIFDLVNRDLPAVAAEWRADHTAAAHEMGR